MCSPFGEIGVQVTWTIGKYSFYQRLSNTEYFMVDLRLTEYGGVFGWPNFSADFRRLKIRLLIRRSAAADGCGSLRWQQTELRVDIDYFVSQLTEID